LTLLCYQQYNFTLAKFNPFEKCLAWFVGPYCSCWTLWPWKFIGYYLAGGSFETYVLSPFLLTLRYYNFTYSLTCWTLLDHYVNLLDIILPGRDLLTFVLLTVQVYVSEVLPLWKMFSLICWTMLDHSENLLENIIAVRALNIFVLPTAQLYVTIILSLYKISSLICWILLDHSKNLLNI